MINAITYIVTRRQPIRYLRGL